MGNVFHFGHQDATRQWDLATQLSSLAGLNSFPTLTGLDALNSGSAPTETFQYGALGMEAPAFNNSNGGLGQAFTDSHFDMPNTTFTALEHLESTVAPLNGFERPADFTMSTSVLTGLDFPEPTAVSFSEPESLPSVMHSAAPLLQPQPTNGTVPIAPQRAGRSQDAVTNRRFRCEQCQKSFTRAADLRRHMKKHTGGPGEFRCEFPECDKAFYRRDKLQAHQKAHSRRHSGRP